MHLRAFLQKRRDEGLQLMADIDDQIGLIDRFRVRRLHLIAVRRALPDKQFRFGDAVHYLGGKRLHRLDGGDNFRCGQRLATDRDEGSEDKFLHEDLRD